MSSDILLEIVSICRQLDEHAVEIYRQLGAVSSDMALAGFWKHMSRDEEEHVAYWKSLEQVAQHGGLPQFFDDPTTTLAELGSHLAKMNALLAQSRLAKDAETAFLVASGLEFYLLYPALVELWHFAEEVLGIAGSPATAYEAHIENFVSALRRFGKSTLTLELFSETIRRLWSQNRKLAIDAQTDALTGLTNRRSLFAGMSALGRLAQRNHAAVAILIIDIDSFKRVNDQRGHQRGDEVLKRVARAIRQAVRRSDIVARFGGEEFLIFLPEVAPALLHEIAEKVRSGVSDLGDEVEGVTVSVGAASGLLEGDVTVALQRLIGRADKSLYGAKAKGKNASMVAPVDADLGEI